MNRMTILNYYLQNNPEVLQICDDVNELIDYDTQHLLQLSGDPQDHPVDPAGAPLFDVALLDKTIGSVAAF